MQGKFTISDIKTANTAAGYNFFDSESMKFFDSRVESGVYSGQGGVYFVTSEQFHGMTERAPRRFTIRRFDPETGRVHSHGEFNSIETLCQAREAAKFAAKGAR